jgi:outer membrane protein TolC
MIGEAKSVEALRTQVINSVFSVQQAYWGLVGAREDLRVQRLGLRLAEDLLRQNRIQVKVGTLAPIDELQAKAQMAAASTQVITAENRVHQAQDALLALTTRDSEMLSSDVRVDTTDPPAFQLREVDFEESLRTALARRPDLKVASLDLQDKTLARKQARNNVLPSATLNFATGFSGLAGDPNSIVNPFNAVPAGVGVLGTPFVGQSTFGDATRHVLQQQLVPLLVRQRPSVSYRSATDARAQYSRQARRTEGQTNIHTHRSRWRST